MQSHVIHVELNEPDRRDVGLFISLFSFVKDEPLAASQVWLTRFGQTGLEASFRRAWITLPAVENSICSRYQSQGAITRTTEATLQHKQPIPELPWCAAPVQATQPGPHKAVGTFQAGRTSK